MSIRPVKRLIKSKPTTEGAGVHLRRAFGFGNTTDFDPFLLLDDFRNDVPEDYLAGFPWHPHRGIETITYVLAGTVEHGDSMGNHGAIAAGDVQWMTAGSGIIHQEMPKGDRAGRMHGFQLWANLPSALKIDRAALSRSESAGHSRDQGRRRDARARSLRNILGKERTGGRYRRRSYLSGCLRSAWAQKNTASGNHAARVRLRFRREWKILQRIGAARGAYRTGGLGGHETASGSRQHRSLVLFDRGDELLVQAGDEGIRFLLVSGKPLEEPVAWYGPIVMNTQEQLRQGIQRAGKRDILEAGRPRLAGNSRAFAERIRIQSAA